MSTEELPSGSMHATDFESDGWALPFPPPLKFIRSGFVNPIGREPFDDVVMARDGDELAARVGCFGNSPDGFGDRSTTNSGNGSVDDGGKLVDDDGYILVGLVGRCV